MLRMLALALGLGSSVCWGIADFVGGLQSRRVPVAAVTLISQSAGLAGILAILAFSGQAAPTAGELAPAALAGMGGTVALTAFYRALALGTMSIVAPISATGAAVPVFVGLAAGERPGAFQVAGILAAGVGVVLAARERHDDDAGRASASRLSIGLALFAALGFGSFFVGMDAAAEADVLWALLVARATSVIMLVAFAAATRPRLAMGAATLRAVIAVGVLDLAANSLYALGSTQGLLSVVAVLGSLYPVTTVLLARALLGERIRRVQQVGVLTAIAGVVLIAAG